MQAKEFKESSWQTAPMGVVKAREAEKKFQLLRFPPSPELAPFVKHHWIVSWNLGGEGHYDQDVIPNPCVNLVAEDGRIALYGVSSGKYTKHLSGSGRAYGVKFHPGGFYPYVQTPLSRLTDGSMDLMDAFQDDGKELANAFASSEPSEVLISHAEQLLLKKLPAPDPLVSYINEMIDYMQNNRSVTRVEQICSAFDIHVRKLQRLFDKYVGVSPKWVIHLYRMQNAAETLDRHREEDWSRLSLELGFFDQSHFIRAFKSMLGVTPEHYLNGQSQG